MSETVFTKVDYDLGSLVKYIALGEIGWLAVDRVDNGGRCGRSGEDEQTGRR